MAPMNPYFWAMHLIDTHAHLYSSDFDADRPSTVKRAIDLGINSFVLPAIESASTVRMDALKNEFPEHMYLMAGLHPTHVKSGTVDQELAHVKERLATGHMVAVGEIGIDLYWDKTTLGVQQDAFRKQVQMATENGLPIAIHCREAFDEVFAILDERKDDLLRGIFHCFTGNLAQAKKAISLNLKLGIGGVVTFKNGKIDQFLDQIAIEGLVLETDAPYLAPVPHRGKRNESAYLVLIAEKVAQIYGLTVNEVCTITSRTASAVFGIKQS